MTMGDQFSGNGWSGGPFVAGDHLFRDKPIAW